MKNFFRVIIAVLLLYVVGYLMVYFKDDFSHWVQFPFGKITAKQYWARVDIDRLNKQGTIAGVITEKGDNYIIIKSKNDKLIKHVFKRGPYDFDAVLTDFNERPNLSPEQADERFTRLKPGVFVFCWTKDRKIGISQDIVP